MGTPLNHSRHAPVPTRLTHEPEAQEAVQGEGDGGAAAVPEPPSNVARGAGALGDGLEDALLGDIQFSERPRRYDGRWTSVPFKL